MMSGWSTFWSKCEIGTRMLPFVITHWRQAKTASETEGDYPR